MRTNSGPQECVFKGNRSGNGFVVGCCLVCGALVENTDYELHAEWHGLPLAGVPDHSDRQTAYVGNPKGTWLDGP